MANLIGVLLLNKELIMNDLMYIIGHYNYYLVMGFSPSEIDRLINNVTLKSQTVSS